MGRWDDLKKFKDGAAAKLSETDVGRLAGDVVVGAAAVINSFEAVGSRSGLIDKEGDVSKLNVTKAALRPKRTARLVLRAAAQEIEDRRDGAAGAAGTSRQA